jgi:hypothetical protein
LRVDFLDFTTAQPDATGNCVTDVLTVTGGNSVVPPICGDNTGQHFYVDFNGDQPITLSVATTASSFNRHWNLQATQIPCAGVSKAPSGCLQYYWASTGTIRSFNYGTTPNPNLNMVGVFGTRQIASTTYASCIRMGASQCSITLSRPATAPFSVSGDATMAATALNGDANCAADYLVIPNPAGNDRFCGTSFTTLTSTGRPFIIESVTDATETGDVANLGFALSYTQNACPVAG